MYSSRGPHFMLPDYFPKCILCRFFRLCTNSPGFCAGFAITSPHQHKIGPTGPIFTRTSLVHATIHASCAVFFSVQTEPYDWVVCKGVRSVEGVLYTVSVEVRVHTIKYTVGAAEARISDISGGW